MLTSNTGIWVQNLFIALFLGAGIYWLFDGLGSVQLTPPVAVKKEKTPYVAKHPQSITGDATALDGDTLVMNGVEIDIYGIAAPEVTEICIRDGKEWPCGDEARRKLDSFEGHADCVDMGKDPDGIQLVSCFLEDGTDIAALMVESGFAVANRKATNVYVEYEARAQKAKAGLWSGGFLFPEKCYPYGSCKPPLGFETLKKLGPGGVSGAR